MCVVDLIKIFVDTVRSLAQEMMEQQVKWISI